jgi:hypothetical protein
LISFGEADTIATVDAVPPARLLMTRCRVRILRVTLLILVAWCATAPGATPASPGFEIAPVPRWVKPFTATAVENPQPDNGGIAWLLLDRQISVEPRAFFRHETRQIVSEGGVQEGAAISVSFDPEYEKLTLHAITVTRGGIATNRLRREDVKLLRRERDLENFLYDGSHTARCDLEDVRVGDVLDFAYTIEGSNPVMGGRFATIFSTQWSYPVGRAITRFVFPARRKLQFLPRYRTIQPAVSTERGVTEWLCDQSNLAGRRVAGDSPSDYDPRGIVEVSEFQNWREVVAWALPLFSAAGPMSPELTAEMEKLRGIADVEERVVAALRFVQDGIRYLGMESGVGSHRPTPPVESCAGGLAIAKSQTAFSVSAKRSPTRAGPSGLATPTKRWPIGYRFPSSRATTPPSRK